MDPYNASGILLMDRAEKKLKTETLYILCLTPAIGPKEIFKRSICWFTNDYFIF